MPRFYFHVTRDVEEADEEGIELVDTRSVKREASKLMGALLHEESTSIWDHDVALQIVDERGLSVATVQVIGTLSPAYGAGSHQQ